MKTTKLNIKKIAALLLTLISLVMLTIPASASTTPPNKTKANVQIKLATLITRLEGKYFTTDGKVWNSNTGSKCYNANVIKSSWLKNTMGLVPDSYSLMPEHYYNGSGGTITRNAWSCAGFANYCLWYIYANKSSDDVFPTKIYAGKFTKSDLDKSGVWPGDVIRVGNAHSMIYISHSSSGVKVFDSNFGDSGPDNKVRVHTISFGNWRSGQTMAITRGKNYTASNSQSSGGQSSAFNVNFSFKSGAYTNAYSSYSCSSYVGRVYPNDIVTIQSVSNGVAKLSCPWENSGNKIVYCRISELKFKATKYIQAYSSLNGDSCGRVYPDDIVSISEIYSSGWMKAVCPWTGGVNKVIYIKCSSIY